MRCGTPCTAHKLEACGYVRDCEQGPMDELLQSTRLITRNIPTGRQILTFLKNIGARFSWCADLEGARKKSCWSTRVSSAPPEKGFSCRCLPPKSSRPLVITPNQPLRLGGVASMGELSRSWARRRAPCQPLILPWRWRPGRSTKMV